MLCFQSVCAGCSGKIASSRRNNASKRDRTSDSSTELGAIFGIDLDVIVGKIAGQYSFLGIDEIPDNAYKGVSGVQTVSVHALWVTSARQADDLIYGITAALWNPNTRKLLDSGHAKGRDIRLETALTGVGIPLHPGAERFYREKGLAK